MNGAVRMETNGLMGLACDSLQECSRRLDIVINTYIDILYD
jgi:hypothetical protein